MSEPEDDDSSYLREVIEDYAREVLFDHAVEILKAFREYPFLDVTGDQFAWPYAGKKSEFSFADELFWVMKQEHVPELAMWGYEREISVAARKRAEDLSEAEER
ncbi:MAG: hypothetical protein WA957_05935, partial [Alteraurantiacibacter sp.]